MKNLKEIVLTREEFEEALNQRAIKRFEKNNDKYIDDIELIYLTKILEKNCRIEYFQYQNSLEIDYDFRIIKGEKQ